MALTFDLTVQLRCDTCGTEATGHARCGIQEPPKHEITIAMGDRMPYHIEFKKIESMDGKYWHLARNLFTQFLFCGSDCETRMFDRPVYSQRPIK